MNTVFVYDDSAPVPAEIAGMTGLVRFGALLHERRRLADHVDAAAKAAGYAVRVRVADLAEATALAERLAEAPADARYVWVTSDVIGPPGLIEPFLGKLAYCDRDTVATPAGAALGSCAGSLSARSLRRLLVASGRDRRAVLAEMRGSYDEIPGDALQSLADPDTFVAFLSGGFYTRAFNRMKREGRTVCKESSDRDKIKKEHDFWYILPHPLKRFFVQPFDLRDGDGVASYRMERLHVPDVAVTWVHGAEAVPDEAFAALLDGLFEFLGERPRRVVTADQARAITDELYATKVARRVGQFLDTDAGRSVDRLLTDGTARGGLKAHLDAYERLRVAIGAGSAELAVSHGDLCFSNVLFDRRTRMIKLIDPRGASSEAELWSDPTYDVAKLSHSILGGYDFVNHGLFEVTVGEDLALVLRVDRPPVGARERSFVARLTAAGYDLRRTRLYEASLFLSMLPLHAELPRKTLAFALIAGDILDELDRSERSSGWLARG